MNLYSEGELYKLYQGDMRDMLNIISPNSIDSIVTDPPYELNFMSKGWDNSGVAFQKDTWEKCFSVLKPGGYLLAFGGTRTFHRIACAIEDAGFEIRDTIMWLYGSGFPKSMDIGKAVDKKNGVEPIGRKDPTGGITGGKYTGAEDKGWHSINNWYEYPECQNEWKGWGTALKPAYEPIIIARKPCEGTIVDNVLKHGVGGINIEECRIGDEERTYGGMSANKPEGAGTFRDDNWQPKDIEVTVNGRFPSNVILTYEESDEKEVCGGMLSDEGNAARYFYCAKASAKDRDEGLDSFEAQKFTMMATNDNIDADGNFTGMLRGRETTRRNIHPTVKPCELMQYLVRLVTPKGGTVLDPFNGSGSTGKAVMFENRENQKDYKYIGIELTEQYLPIAKARIEYAQTIAIHKVTDSVMNRANKQQQKPKELDRLF